MDNYLGEIAALGTAVCWSIGPTLFTVAGRHIGSAVVNRIRLAIAVLFLLMAHFLLQGEFLPIHTELFRWKLLGLSGIIGLAVGDSFLFQAFVLIGPQLSMLLMSFAPIITAFISWIFLNETLNLMKIVAIILTISGIILVILRKKELKTPVDRKHYIIGILCGIGGAVGQAVGLIIAKKGLAGSFSGLSATLIRVSVATVVIWLFTAFSGKIKYTFNKLQDKKITLTIILGSFTGPFLGIWLSMVAIKYTYIGIASTLMALPPIFLLPISHWVFKEEITLQSIIGTIVAAAGTAIIFLT